MLAGWRHPTALRRIAFATTTTAPNCGEDGALYEVRVEAEGSDIPADILSAMTGGA